MLSGWMLLFYLLCGNGGVISVRSFHVIRISKLMNRMINSFNLFILIHLYNAEVGNKQVYLMTLVHLVSKSVICLKHGYVQQIEQYNKLNVLTHIQVIIVII